MASNGWATLQNREFALLCGLRVSSTLASNISNVAIAWYVYEVTGDAFALAYLGLAQFVPALLLVMFSGLAADRIDRRLLLFIASSILASMGVILLVIIWFQPGLVWPLYAIVFAKAAARSFTSAPTQAMLPNLVPKSDLASALAINTGAFNAATIAGPAIGGFLYAIYPLLPFIVTAALWCLTPIAALAIRYRPVTEIKKPPVTVKSLLAGFEFAWSRPVVFGAISLDAMVVLLGGLTVLLPIYAKDILDVGPTGLGLMRSAPAAGSLLMAAYLAHNNFAQRNTATRLFQTIAVFGLATVAFGLSENFLFSLAALFIVGASDMVSVVIRHTLVQAETPDDVRGRVTAVNQFFASSTGQLGDFRSGLIAGLVGPMFSAVTGGLAVVALVVIWPLLFPDLRRRNYLVEEDKKETARA